MKKFILASTILFSLSAQCQTKPKAAKSSTATATANKPAKRPAVVSNSNLIANRDNAMKYKLYLKGIKKSDHSIDPTTEPE